MLGVYRELLEDTIANHSDLCVIGCGDRADFAFWGLGPGKNFGSCCSPGLLIRSRMCASMSHGANKIRIP